MSWIEPYKVKGRKYYRIRLESGGVIQMGSMDRIIEVFSELKARRKANKVSGLRKA